MALRETSSKRTRAYNIFVGAFFLAVFWIMIAAGLYAEGQFSLRMLFLKNAAMVAATLAGLVGAIIYYRRASRS